MKNILILTLMSFGIAGLIATSAMACNCGKKNKNVTAMSCQCKTDSCGMTTSAVIDEAENSKKEICPVSGKPIGSMGKGVEHVYAGKTYKLCCEGCLRPFKDNPEKYLKKSETK